MPRAVRVKRPLSEQLASGALVVLNFVLLLLVVLGTLPAPAAIPALRRICRRCGMAPALGWLLLVPGAGCALALAALALGRWTASGASSGEQPR